MSPQALRARPMDALLALLIAFAGVMALIGLGHAAWVKLTYGPICGGAGLLDCPAWRTAGCALLFAVGVAVARLCADDPERIEI